MRKIISFLSIIVICNIATAHEAQTPRLITVTGTYEIKVKPDEAHITIGVNSVGTDIEKIKKENDSQIRNVIKTIKKNGVGEKDLKTSNFSISQDYSRPSDKKEAIRYRVSNTLSVHLKDLSQLEKIINGVVKNGANQLQGVEFTTSKLKELETSARAGALKNAKTLANEMAAELGQKVGEPYSVSEPQSQIYGGRTQMAMMKMEDSIAPTIAQGQISISTNVIVSFELLSKNKL